ncbi:hypothetical protein Tco_0443450 [Tanacetum coccineum]
MKLRNDVCCLFYRPVSNRNNDITSGKKNQVAVPSKDVSNSSPFDAFNSVENDNDLGTNEGNSKSAGKGPNSGVSLSNHGLFNGASSRKLTLLDDDGKPLSKVVSTENADSDYEVEDVVDDHAIFMASTVLKRGDDSRYGTNSLLEQ